MVGRKHETEELNKLTYDEYSGDFVKVINLDDLFKDSAFYFVCKKENADRFKFKGIYTV